MNTLPAPLPDQSHALATHSSGFVFPALIHHAGEKTARRFLEFFAVTISNRNTRAAYYRACCKFFRWCDARGLHDLGQIEPLIVAAFIEEEKQKHHAQTVKQELAALRQLFDYLVTGQIMPFNPASSVRGPTYSSDEGKTPILSQGDARQLLDSIPTARPDGAPDVIGLRDRALIGLMIYSFARVSAVIGMALSDYRQNGKRYQVQLHEKGGIFHKLPVHHKAEEYLDAYIEAAQLGEDRKAPLFRSTRGRSGTLTDRVMQRGDVFRMVKRRAKGAGVALDIGCHSFRGTGITAFLKSGGSIENAQMIAKHKSPRTTKLYDRRREEITLTEIERIMI